MPYRMMLQNSAISRFGQAARTAPGLAAGTTRFTASSAMLLRTRLLAGHSTRVGEPA
jgi:hypothetical protein